MSLISEERFKNMTTQNPIGVMAGLSKDGNSFTAVRDFGLNCCQLVNWDVAMWNQVEPRSCELSAMSAGVKVAAVWAGYPGPSVWDNIFGPYTLGLVPEAYRAIRVEALIRAADWAKAFGAPAIITHCGFIPVDAAGPTYQGTLAAVYKVAAHCRDLGLEFWFETGQETPTTLLRFIEDLRLPNLGINLDPANLILYGMGNPLDSLDVFGRYVRCVHAKDGLYPVNGRALGREVKVGSGKVNFPELVRRLRDDFNYAGAYVIEREISGPEQSRDIAETVEYLKTLIG